MAKDDDDETLTLPVRHDCKVFNLENDSSSNILSEFAQDFYASENVDGLADILSCHDFVDEPFRFAPSCSITLEPSSDMLLSAISNQVPDALPVVLDETIARPATKITSHSRALAILAVIVMLGAAVFGIVLLEGYESGRRPFELLRPVTSAPTYIPVKPSNLTVGVYYYPWYYNDFHSHGSYLRNQLQPPQYPSLGEYNDHDPIIIGQHLAWSRQANVQLWVTSWWGPNDRTDIATLKIMKHRDIGTNKVALFYESRGRILGGSGLKLDNVASDMDYICTNYFGNEKYFTIHDGRPVLFVYLTRKLHELDLLVNVIDSMRITAASHGYNPYIVGDQVFARAPIKQEGSYLPFDYLDGVTGYDVFGSIMSTQTNQQASSSYAGTNEGVQEYIQQSQEWKRLAQLQSCTFIPAVTPGYNDRGGKSKDADKHIPLSRRLTRNEEAGSLFRTLLEEARYLVDEGASNLLMVTSFNEWHEDTQIEPTVITDSVTALPLALTQGVEYEGYGALYLNILRNMTEDDDDDTVIIHSSVNATSSLIHQNSSVIGNLANATLGGNATRSNITISGLNATASNSTNGGLTTNATHWYEGLRLNSTMTSSQVPIWTIEELNETNTNRTVVMNSTN